MDYRHLESAYDGVQGGEFFLVMKIWAAGGSLEMIDDFLLTDR